MCLGFRPFLPFHFRFFQPFVADADKSGCDYTAGDSASPTVLLLCRSLPAQSRSVTKEIALVLNEISPPPLDRLMHFFFPKANARVLCQVSPCGFCGGHCGSGTGCSPSTLVFLGLSFHQCSCYVIYHRRYTYIQRDSK